MVAVVLIALSVIVQAGVLVAMYLMSRKMSDKADVLMNDTKWLKFTYNLSRKRSRY